MKNKRISAIAMVAAILAVNASAVIPIAPEMQPMTIVHAASQSSNGFITESQATVSATNIGATYGDAVINLNELKLNDGAEITSIGADAFSRNWREYNDSTELIIIIPSSVKSIDEKAFGTGVTIAVDYNSYAHAYATSHNYGYGSDSKNEKKYIFTSDLTSTNNKPDEYDKRGEWTGSVKKWYNNDTLTTERTYDDITNIDGIVSVTYSDCTITGYTGSAESVTIPKEINNTRITSIAKNAFKDNANITSINMSGADITSIGENAFSNCTKLETVKWPANLQSIGGYAFSFTNISNLNLPESVVSIGEGAFYYNTQITALTLPDGIQFVGTKAFGNCTKLATANVPESLRPDENQVQKIQNGAFWGSVTICGESNSYAEEYANANHLAFRPTSQSAVNDADMMKFISYSEDITNNGIRIEKIHDYTLRDDDGDVIESKTVPENFRIPDKIDGKNVTSISSNVFENPTIPKTIYLPDSIVSLSSSVFKNCTFLEEINIPAKVTTIPDNAFSGCTSLKEIELGSNITSIGKYAFSGCTGLTTISGLPAADIPEGAFDGCTSLSLSEISVKNTIGSNAFRNCEAITSINIDTEEYTITGTDTKSRRALIISSNAFAGCKNMTAITTSKNVSSIGAGAFSGCAKLNTLPSLGNIDKIPNQAFYNCEALKSITIPASAASIGDNAFENCTALSGINIDSASKMTSIGSDAFANSGLTSFTVPDGVTVLSTRVFNNCRNLKKITLHDNIRTISIGVFTGCESLEEIKMPESITSIRSELFKNCSSLKTVTLSSKTTTIEESAFENCTALTSINIPSTCVNIRKAAFKETNIGSIILPENTTIINESAFESCKNLTSVKLSGGKVTTINKNAFKDCENLKTFTFNGSIKTVGESAFENTALTQADMSGTQIEKIPDNMFLNANTLATVILPSTVREIGVSAFENTAVSEITIPDKQTEAKIYSKAFANCSNLEKITILKNVRFINSDILSGSSKATVYGNVGSPANTYAVDNNIPFQSVDPLDEGDGQYDGFYYTINGTYVTIIGCVPEKEGDITIPETIRDLPVKIINENAFANNKKITSFAVPDCIDTIRQGAFYNCTAVKSVTLPSAIRTINDNVFSGCTALKEITLPESVQSIGVNAFQNCTSLTKMTLPASVNWLGEGAFNHCSNLESIETESGITVIPKNAFSDCTKLKTAKFGPEGNSKVVTIRERAFCNCTAMTECNAIGEKTTAINDEAFMSCRELTKIDVSKVNSLGARAFAHCVKLSDIKLPNIKTIPNYLLQGCTSLTSIKIPDTVTSLGERAFAGSGITEIALSNNITAIKDGVFESCSDLTKVSLPSKIETIPAGMFRNCRLLKDITIPDTVKYIQSEAFINCSALGELTMSRNIKSIGDNSFDSGSAEPNAESHLKMNVYMNSTAHIYADENNIKYEIIDKESIPESGNTRPTLSSSGSNNSGQNITQQEAEDIVKKDYEDRTGNTVANVTTVDGSSPGELIITVTDENGGSELYTVSTDTGSYIHSSGEHVQLPQTGVTSWTNRLLAVLALAMTGIGVAFVKASNVFRRKRGN